MLSPEIIDKLRREKEERERLDNRIPLYTPDSFYPRDHIDDDEPTESKGVIVIEIA